MGVIRLAEHRENEMAATCHEMLRRIKTGQVNSLLALVQVQGDALPQIVLLGQYKDDPYRALVALERALVQVHRELDALPAANHFVVVR